MRSVVDISQSLTAPVVLDQNDYLPFGTRVSNSQHAQMGTNRWRYAGKEAFPELNQLDFGARMYDPFTARWTAVDPMAGKYAGRSSFMYCADDPVNRIDTNGQIDKEWLKKGGSTLGVGLVATIGGGFAVSSGVGVMPGVYALATGIPSIGLGVGMIIIGLTTDPTPEGRQELEAMPTGVLNSIGKATDQVLETENHQVERVADLVDAVIGLGTLSKPKSIMEAVINGATIAQAGIAADKLNDLAGQSGVPSSSSSKTERIEGYEKTDWQEDLRQYSLWKPSEYQSLNIGAY